MFLSEHIGLGGVVALTESGGTANFLSRFRSSVPVYAFSRDDGARRRMAMMRGVTPVAFDSRGMVPREAARASILHLVQTDRLKAGDKVVFTSGEHMEMHGATNTLRLLEVGEDGRASGLGEL
jgi:pyruvate kinase